MIFLKTYFYTLITLLLLDVPWLILMRGSYDKWLSGFERTVNWTGVVLVYIFIPLGLSYLVVNKFIGQNQWSLAFLAGFIYGISSYAVYEFTNLATLKGWSFTMSIVDTVWGGILCGLTTLLVLYFLK